MAENNDVRMRVGYEVDARSISEIIQSTKRISDALKAVRSESGTVEMTAQRLALGFDAIGRSAQIDRVVADFREARAGGEDLQRAIQRVVTEIDRLGASEAEIDRVTRSLSEMGGAAASATRQVSTAQAGGGAVRSGGGTRSGVVSIGTSSLAGAGDAATAQTVNAVTNVTGALTMLGPAAAVAVGAVELFSVAMRNAENAAKRAISEINRELDRNAELRRDLFGMTTDEVNAYIDRQRSSFEQTRADLEDAFAARDTFWEESDWVARTRIGAGTDAVWNELTERINGLNAELAGTSDNMADAIDWVNAGKTADADREAAARAMTEAEEQLAQTRLDAIEQQRRFELSALDLARTGTMDDFNARLRDMDIDRAALDRARQSVWELGLSTEVARAQAEAYTEQIVRLTEEEQWLLAHVKPVIEAREKEAAALERLNQSAEARGRLMDAVTAAVEAQEAVTAAQTAINEYSAEAGERLAALETERQEKLAELRERYAEQEIRAQEDTRDNIARIQRQAGRSIEEAIANRDAVANTQARRRAEDQLTDEQQQAAKESQRRRQDYAKQEREAISAANKQLQIEVQKFNKELLVRQQALQRSLIDLANAKEAERMLAAQAGVVIANQAYTTGITIGSSLVQGFIQGSQMAAAQNRTTQVVYNMTAYTVPTTEIQRQVRAALDASFTQITRGGR